MRVFLKVMGAFLVGVLIVTNVDHVVSAKVHNQLGSGLTTAALYGLFGYVMWLLVNNGLRRKG